LPSNRSRLIASILVISITIIIGAFTARQNITIAAPTNIIDLIETTLISMSRTTGGIKSGTIDASPARNGSIAKLTASTRTIARSIMFRRRRTNSGTTGTTAITLSIISRIAATSTSAFQRSATITSVLTDFATAIASLLLCRQTRIFSRVGRIKTAISIALANLIRLANS
jgi:hypothetical protein